MIRHILHFSILGVITYALTVILWVDSSYQAGKRFEGEQDRARDSLKLDGKFRADSIRGYWKYRSDSLKARGRR